MTDRKSRAQTELVKMTRALLRLRLELRTMSMLGEDARDVRLMLFNLSECVREVLTEFPEVPE